MADNLRVGARLTADGTGFTAGMRTAQRELDALGRAGRGAGESLDRGMAIARRGVESISKQLANLKSAALGAAGIASLGTMAAQAISAADSLTNLSARLNLVTGSSERTARVQAQLFEISQASRVGYVDLGNTYAQVARSSAELGVSHDRLLTVTQALSQAMAISGGSAASQQAAMVQLSQGLASGTLRGEELNSILEQTPRVAQAIADGMGVSVGQLRRLGQEGSLTARAVIEALERSAPQLAREFDKIRPTVSGAFQVLRNSATDFIGEVDRSSGATRQLGDALISLAGSITAAKSGLAGFLETAKPLAEMALWAGGGIAFARALQTIAAVGVGSGMMALLGRMGGFLGGPVGIAAGIGAAVAGAATAEDAAERIWQVQIERALARNGGRETGEVQYLRERLNVARVAAGKLILPTLLPGAPATDSYEQSAEQAAGVFGPDARLGAARRAAAAYAADKDNMSKAALAARDRLEAVQAYKQVVDDLVRAGAEEADIAQARAALMQRLANIEAKYKLTGGLGAAADRRQARAVDLADQRAAIEASERRQIQAIESQTRSGVLSEEQAVRRRGEVLAESIRLQREVAEQAMRAAGSDLSDGARVTAEINRLAREREQVDADMTNRLGELAAERQRQVDEEVRGFRLARAQQAEAVRASVRTMEDENRARRIALATGIGEDEAIRQIELERLEQQLEVDERPDPDKVARLQALRDELELLRERREILDPRAAEDGVAAKALAEQEGDLTRSVTDALYRGFENGKGFAQNFADVMKNTFATTVLRPLIEPIVKPFSRVMNAVGESVMESLLAGLGGVFGGGGAPMLAGDSPLAATGEAIRGRRARGGAVWGGGTYLVGEEGPELLSIGRGAAGYVTPHGETMRALNGEQRIETNVYLTGGVSEADVVSTAYRAAALAEQRIADAYRRRAPRFRGA